MVRLKAASLRKDMLSSKAATPHRDSFPHQTNIHRSKAGMGPPALPSPGYDPRAVAIGDAHMGCAAPFEVL